jgi:chemosensory pili system protein ChpB (putative protein-glutamate methylesterase)
MSFAGQGSAARRVCVLAGSMGGPAGLRRFFQSLNGTSLPVVFIIIIPINPDALPLLCDYVARYTRMRVLPAISGHLLRHGEVVVIPSDRLLIVDESGHVRLVAPAGKLLNPVDVTMKALVRHFRRNTGAIIFSGIGEDGQQGCRAIAEHQGEIWTQSEQSCHFGSLPRYIGEVCKVRYSDTPENMASRLLQELTAVGPRRHNAVVA